MPVVTYDARGYECQENETVLDCLTRNGVAVPFACRSGICHTCMLQASQGEVPVAAQNGLKDEHKAKQRFLACSCIPHGDMTVSLPLDGVERYHVNVLSKESLAPDVVRLRLSKGEFPDYRAGQFLTLFNPAGVGRNYSLASLPEDGFLELHIRTIASGAVSGWVASRLEPGDQVELAEAVGECFYTPGRSEQPLAMVATGTGLAPLYGIARDAIRQGHRGRIMLFHGVRTREELYLHAELQALAAQHENFVYHPSLSAEMAGEGYYFGRANDAALGQIGDFSGWRVYLCGNAQMVESTRQKVLLAGAASQDIYSDAFIPAEG